MSATQTITLSMPEPDVAALTLDMPGKGANILSVSVLDELAAHLDALETRTDLAGLIIHSAKPGIFIAGADIREFAASLNIAPEQTVQMCRRGQTLFGRLAKTPFVTVAAIDGICVGGGAELAIWCDRRLMTTGPKTEFGFPEVKLGLFPGWGGTARAPRIIGLSNALEMITSGESVDAEAAWKMNLASDFVAGDQLLRAAINLIRMEQRSGDYLKDRKRWSGPIAISETELGFLGVTASAYVREQTKGQYPAPEAAIEVMLSAAGADIETACQLEAEGMSKLFGSPINAALINVFFLTDRNKKDTGIDDSQVNPAAVRSVAVIGAGIMGCGIAAANVKRDMPVTLTDASSEARAAGTRAILEEVSFNRKTKRPDVERAVRMAPLLKGTTSDSEIAGCDLVIEAVVENADVKRQIYARLEPLLGENTILASNTSTIPITSLARDLKRPDQFCGIHFFNPVRRMTLVEVIRGEKTSDQTVATAVAYAKRIGKSPIVVHDGPGFLVNRLLLPYMNEALELICEGAAIQDIERASRAFGMPMGPITLYDVVGLDTALYAGRTMWEAFPDRITASPVLPALVKAGRLGQKSGAGFFTYQGKKNRGAEDPALARFITPYIREQRRFTPEELTSRLFLPMVLEATRVLEAKIVRDVRDIDLGLIFGLGFPPFKGGLLFWADTLGAAKIVEMLKPLEYLGGRAQPTPWLLQMAQEGRKFYQ